MKNVAKRFDSRGNALLNKAVKEKASSGQLSAGLRAKRSALVADIAQACALALETCDLSEVIATQVKIKPDYMVGLEDFTIPVMMLCGLMHPVFEPQAEEVAPFQAQTAELFSRQQAGDFGHAAQLKTAHQFLVLHAYDYQSALQGAQVVAGAQPGGLAISYGGPMKSKRWITSLNLGETTRLFDEKLPEPYLIATALTLGVANGTRSDLPVHILGVGSPILVAMIAHMLPRSKAISIDSTAPFKDANAGTLYGAKYAFMKMDMYKVAAYALIDNKPFTSRTPFFKQFEQDFPSNWAGLRAELGVTSASNFRQLARLLESEKQLVEEFIPFFSKMRSGKDEMMQRLRMDRAGHNFWILRNICVAVRSRMDDPVKVDRWMKYQVDRYKKVASYKWSKATELSFDISRTLRPAD